MYDKQVRRLLEDLIVKTHNLSPDDQRRIQVDQTWDRIKLYAYRETQSHSDRRMALVAVLCTCLTIFLTDLEQILQAFHR